MCVFAAGQKDTRSVYGGQHRCQPGWCSDGREFLKLWDQSCSSGFASWDLGQGAISAAGRRWYLGLVTVRCPKMPSPGPDFSFRLLVHSPALTHLSGGQYASHGDVWVSLEASAGLMLGQPWEVQGCLGVSGCTGMSSEPFQSRDTDFCPRAKCLGCFCLGRPGWLLQQASRLLSGAAPAEPTNCPGKLIHRGYSACKTL